MAYQKPGCIYQHPHDHECRNEDDMRENAFARQEAINEIERKFRDFWSDDAVVHDYAFHPSLLFRLLDEMRQGK